MVRVLPDLAGLNRAFDYAVPGEMAARVAVGTMVRIILAGRRVNGWVVEDGVEPPPGVELLAVLAVRGTGPAPEVVELARWAAWRWAGRPAQLLATASPPTRVGDLPPPAPAGRPEGRAPAASPYPVSEALSGGPAVLRLPPAAPRWPVVREAARRGAGGSVLVLVPSVDFAGRVAAQLRAEGFPAALLPRQWAEAAAGGRVVVGARAGAWGPAPDLRAVVVLDGHDEVYKEERAPTWSAWQVAGQRAARARVACVVTSPAPTLELLEWGRLVAPDRAAERAGWPVVEVVDRGGDDPRSGLFSARAVGLLRDGTWTEERPLVCVVNRKGRARLLACTACGTLARCEHCGGAMAQARGDDALHCSRCGATRPRLCQSCGAQRLAVLRAGVTRLAEEAAALAGRPAVEVSSDLAGPAGAIGPGAVLVGTEAALHRVGAAGAVVFLDFDQELLAPRFRAAEQAMALICLAGRLVGPRGRVVVQTRLPDHEVLAAAAHGDPARLAAVEAERRSALALPPYSALAVASGEGAPEFVAGLAGAPAVTVVAVADGFWIRAPDHQVLCDALVALPRPSGRLRVEVDPQRI